MNIRRLLQTCLITGSLCIATSGWTMPASPKDLPTDKVAQGNARVDAWRSLRLDLDTLNHGQVHPALVHEWLATAPVSVLRHITTHAMDPTLVQTAEDALLNQHAGDPALFAELSRKWAHSPRLPWFQAARVRVHDTAYTAKLIATLNERSDVIRVTAASILTLAGDRRGKTILLGEISSCGSQVNKAAQIIGSVGGTDERTAIEKSISSGCSAPALKRASGEILFRKLYPVFHDLLVRRDTSDTRYQAENGMYAAWFDIIRVAHGNGVASQHTLLPWLGQFRNFDQVWPTESPEVSRRNIDALVEFLSLAAQRIHAGRASATWPQTWAEALQQLANESRDGFDARVSASIAILRWTDDLAPFSDSQSLTGVTILSPRGNRVIDGNWRSSWQGKTGDTLELEWFPVRDITTLWLATGCVNHPKSVLKKIKIMVNAKDGRFETSRSLNPGSRFYQPVPIDSQSVQKITIEIIATSHQTPVCINEVRIAGH